MAEAAERDPLAAKFFGGSARAGDSDSDRSRDRRKGERHARQLCRQVYRTLSCVIGELADPVLQDLFVHSVEPAPDASRLMVCVAPSAGDEAANVPEILEGLERVRAFLRQEVASAITRKRAPELIFRIVAGGEVMP